MSKPTNRFFYRAFRSSSCTLLLSALLLASGSLQAESTLYQHATLIDASQPAARSKMSLLVVDGRLAAVLPDNDAKWQQLKVDHTVDLSQRYVMPGLVDTHVHLATYPNPTLARAQLELYLMGGITTVRDMAGDTRLLAELRRELLLKEIPGPELHFSALMAGESFFNDPRTQAAAQAETAGQVPWMQAIGSNTNAAHAVAQAKGTYASGIKLYANLLPGDIRRIATEAQQQQMKLWSHGTVFPTRPSELVEAGVHQLSHIYMLGYEVAENMDGTRYDKRPPVAFTELSPEHPKLQQLLQLLKQKAAFLDATLFVINYAANNPLIPAERRAGLPEQYQFSLRMARAAHAAGIRLTTGSDVYVGLEFATPGLWPELEAWQNDAGFSPQEILRAATIHGAEALGIADQIGTLDVGKKANFLILRENPLLDIRAIKSLETTVLQGKPYSRANYQLSPEVWQAMKE